MKITCPGCAKGLNVADNVAGRRVKCPSCAQVFQVPPSTAVVAAPSAATVPAPVKKAPSRPAEAAVKEGVPAPKRARKSCPECGKPLERDAEECPACDWTAEEPAGKKSVKKSARRRADEEDEGGRCYIYIRRDQVDLNKELVRRMTKFIETEQLDLDMMDEDDEPPDELAPGDLVISGRMNVCDYGSQAMRYFLTFVTMFGPGSCKLEVDAEIESEEQGNLRLTAGARQWAGVFGGSGTGLMKQNIKTVARRIATGAARHVTGRYFLNAHAYLCGYWSLGLGFASFIPFIGVPVALVGLVLGVLALLTINGRKLPRGKGVALTGLLLNSLGLLVTVALIFLLR